MSALYLKLKKRKFEISVGSFHEKLLFWDLRLLLTKTQYSSDITSKIQIKRFPALWRVLNKIVREKIRKFPFEEKKNEEKISQRRNIRVTL